MSTSPRRVLAIGAHPDDIEIGCGGAIARHVVDGDAVTMLVVTNGEVGPSPQDRVHEQEAACAVLGVDRLIMGALMDGKVSLQELELVHMIEGAIELTNPDLIYTHGTQDSHQDHRAVALGTMGAARKRSSIMAYDAPSSYGFTPTVFVNISGGYIDKKVDALMCHASQVAASEMVDAHRTRSQAEANGHLARVGAAEGFVPYRLVLP